MALLVQVNAMLVKLLELRRAEAVAFVARLHQCALTMQSI